MKPGFFAIGLSAMTRARFSGRSHAGISLDRHHLRGVRAVRLLPALHVRADHDALSVQPDLQPVDLGRRGAQQGRLRQRVRQVYLPELMRDQGVGPRAADWVDPPWASPAVAEARSRSLGRASFAYPIILEE